MAYTDDYREMIEEAVAALDALFEKSTPDSWIWLRGGYRDLRRALECDDAKRLAEDRRQQRDRFSDQAERQASWRRLPRDRRESLLLHVLGEGRLTLREITRRLNAELGVPEGALPTLFDDKVRPMVRRMVDIGQLERTEESFQGKLRYRYARKRDLEGPISELERAYHERDC